LDPAAGQSAAWIIRRHDSSNHSRINWQLKGCIDYKTAQEISKKNDGTGASSVSFFFHVFHKAFVIYRYFLTNKQL